MLDEARRRIGTHYPEAHLEGGQDATVISWIWARTVTCPNPACGIEMPLFRSRWLCKKKGKETWVRPIIAADDDHLSGKRVEFEIGHGVTGAPSADEVGTVGRHGATCVACGSAVTLDHVRTASREVGLGAMLMAVVAEGDRRRTYLAADGGHRRAAALDRPDSAPDAALPAQALGFRVQNYGFARWADLFTNRQLLALTTFSDLAMEARERAVADAQAAGAALGRCLDEGGDGAQAYGDAVSTYLAMQISRLADLGNALCRWEPIAQCPRQLFARQAIPMVWDFAEGNPLGASSGSWAVLLTGTERAFASDLFCNPQASEGVVQQGDGATLPFKGQLISTDPPYYDNIDYSDLSDFFYVWLRRSLRGVYPDLLSTMLVPKVGELVANPYRHGGEDGAKVFFEDGFRRVFAHAREEALDNFPMCVWYAFKQTDTALDGTASTGWETLLEGMIQTGWAITATWPIRSEASNRMRAMGSNALASSIVLALRPRPDDAPTTDRRGLITALHNELPDALRKLQQGAIAPVDLPQAAIGPGMAVFSRYAKVIENDGSMMAVRSALARINEILDEVLNEQEGDFDSATRFAIAWYRQHGYATGTFGVADDLARARNTAVETLVRDGILTSAAGKVTLLASTGLSEDYDILADDRVGIWEALHHLIAILDRDGLRAAGVFLARAQKRPDGVVDPELVKELSFLLFSIAEKNGWTQDALAFNTVATAWPEIAQAAHVTHESPGEQAAFAFSEDGDDGLL
jgi:putative DNA methylase